MNSAASDDSDLVSCCVVLHQKMAPRGRTGVCLSSVCLNGNELRLRGPKRVKKISPTPIRRQQQLDKRQDFHVVFLTLITPVSQQIIGSMCELSLQFADLSLFECLRLVHLLLVGG